MAILVTVLFLVGQDDASGERRIATERLVITSANIVDVCPYDGADLFVRRIIHGFDRGRGFIRLSRPGYTVQEQREGCRAGDSSRERGPVSHCGTSCGSFCKGSCGFVVCGLHTSYHAAKRRRSVRVRDAAPPARIHVILDSKRWNLGSGSACVQLMRVSAANFGNWLERSLRGLAGFMTWRTSHVSSSSRGSKDIAGAATSVKAGGELDSMNDSAWLSEAVVRANAQRIGTVISRLLGPRVSSSVIDELIQETFLRAYRGKERFDPNGSAKLSTWLCKIALNLARDEQRRVRRREGRLWSWKRVDHEDDGSVDAIDAESKLDDDRQLRALHRALDRLSRAERELIILRGIDGLSYDELTKIVDCSEGTIKSRLSRSRQKLRTMMQEELGK